MNYYPQLLSYTIEIEGLLRVMQQNPSQEAADMLVEKIDAFNALYYEASTSGDYDNEDRAEHDIPPTPDFNIAQDEIPSDAGSDINEIRQAPDMDINPGKTPPVPREMDIERNHMPEPALQQTAPHRIEEMEETGQSREGVRAIVSDDDEITDPDPEIFSEEPKEGPNEVKKAEDEVKKPMRLDEVLIKREFSDLDKAITLNDRFRFTRELFGGSDSLFRQTIATLKTIPTLEEAREYLLFDLGFDAQNENVADFLEIIENHYYSL